MKTITLAHYYTDPEIQQMADRVGDSLDLSRYAAEQKADRIVFAGVKFMAETAKILSPAAQVILPDKDSTCSLVTQLELPEVYGDGVSLSSKIKQAKNQNPNIKVVTYINSDVNLKAMSDIIVTSANVEDIVSGLIADGNQVFFTPDRNMGAYLKSQNPEWGDDFIYYDGAVCEVHDKFKAAELERVLDEWTRYGTYLLAHPESPLPVLEKANYVGSTRGMLQWVKDFKYEYGRIIVATEEGLLYNMREARPKLDIQLAPTYSGCQCNACPYMKMNSFQAVKNAQNGIGYEIDYIDEDLRLKALKPVEAMLNYEV